MEPGTFTRRIGFTVENEQLADILKKKIYISCIRNVRASYEGYMKKNNNQPDPAEWIKQNFGSVTLRVCQETGDWISACTDIVMISLPKGPLSSRGTTLWTMAMGRGTAKTDSVKDLFSKLTCPETRVVKGIPAQDGEEIIIHPKTFAVLRALRH